MAGTVRFSAAFLLLAENADLAAGMVRKDERVRTAFVPVSDVDSAVDVAANLLAHGLDLLELYGGFGPTLSAYRDHLLSANTGGASSRGRHGRWLPPALGIRALAARSRTF